MTISERPHYFVLDDDHRVVPVADVLEWAKWMEDSKDEFIRRVDLTEVSPGVWVSTVFLGLDQRFFGEGPPIVFETMIWVDIPEGKRRTCFGREVECEFLEYQERGCTWEEALEMHAEAIQVAPSLAKAFLSSARSKALADEIDQS